MPFVYPPALAPGDRIAVVAPCSPFPVRAFWRALAWVRDRYRVSIRPDVFDRAGYLAGDDARRVRELAWAMVTPGIKAIVAARGGYGAMRIVDDLPWGEFSRNPRWIVGFSDITALHVAAAGRGIASIHGPNLAGLGHEAGVAARAGWIAALERPRAPRRWSSLDVLHPGTATGVVSGGNLALVAAMAAAGRLRLPPSAVLVLEDVTERPYRIDRMLTALRLGGHLERVAALIFGDFAQCDPGPDGMTVRQVLVERTGGLGIPVLAGAPFGHGACNDAFVLGGHAHVAGTEVRFCADAD